MKNNMLNILETYKKTRVCEPVDLDWLKGKLNENELSELRKQIEYIVLEAEEEAFVSALGYSAGEIGA